MRILALETSTDLGSCALWHDGQLIERRCPAGRPHSETLLPLIRSLLMDVNLDFPQLDAIAFGAGPGAFTGLRVACGVAQGLAVAAELPVVPVGTLEALAEGSGAGKIMALLDARMGEVYYATFRQEDDGLYPVGNVRVASPAEVGNVRVASPAEVELPEGSGWLACGNAPIAYPQLAARLVEVGMEIRGNAMPTAAAVARLAVSRLACGKTVDPALAAPFYVRDKVAQTVAERLAGGGKA